MLWLFEVPFMLIIMVFCYLTNPFVCLFADEEGELPKIFKLWQTWDDSLNPRFFVVEKVPEWLKYDYDKYYDEYWETLPETGRRRCYARSKYAMTDKKDRMKRYICRVLWLMRNCGYGFAFYLFGRKVYGSFWSKMEYHKDDNHYVRFGFEDNVDPVLNTWTLKFRWNWTKHWYSEGYLGWKVPFESHEDAGLKRCMIANRIMPLKYQK